MYFALKIFDKLLINYRFIYDLIFLLIHFCNFTSFIQKRFKFTFLILK